MLSDKDFAPSLIFICIVVNGNDEDQIFPRKESLWLGRHEEEVCVPITILEVIGPKILQVGGQGVQLMWRKFTVVSVATQGWSV